MNVSERYDDIAGCNGCGFCQTACPIFRSTGYEGGVARGRLALLRAVIEGRLEWSPELEEPLYSCLLCGACTSNCFGAIPTAELVTAARAEYLEKVGRKSIHRLLFDTLLPYPRRLHLAARAAALGKNSGASELARALGLLRIFGRDLSRAEAIVDRLPARPFRERFTPGVYDGQGRGRPVAYFVGCGVDVVSHAVGEATLGLLRRFSRSVRVLENNCCGLPAWSYGDLDAARRLAGKHLPLIEAAGADLVVTDCSSCTGFIKKYPEPLSRKRSSAPHGRIHCRQRPGTSRSGLQPRSLPSPGRSRADGSPSTTPATPCADRVWSGSRGSCCAACRARNSWSCRKRTGAAGARGPTRCRTTISPCRCWTARWGISKRPAPTCS